MSWTLKRALSVTALVAGCGGSEPAKLIVLDASVTDAADSLDDEDDGFEGCPDTIPKFALNMQATGNQGHITSTLLSASNVPPLRYLNDWTVSFAAANGAPLADVVIANARPFMPVHGHDGIVQPTIEPLASPGQLRIRGLNFNMRGPWEVQLTLSSSSAGNDYVVFNICIEE